MMKAKLKNTNKSDCCCSSTPQNNENAIMNTGTTRSFKDKFGAFKVRLGINRMNYTVKSGLYSIGNPNSASLVFVTANYKLSFDSLRKELDGMDAYILVLDTKGVNVWCAAGKGTFGTKELIKRIEKTNLWAIVSHRQLILPQLGAAGIAGYLVTKSTGFKITYGPVMASDIKAFVANNLTATEKMRTVQFTILDRAVLTPIEFNTAFPKLMLLFGAFFILNALGLTGFSLVEFIAFLGTIIVGAVITPILLPFIPFKAFSAKGGVLGLLWVVALHFIFPLNLLDSLQYILFLPSISAYLSLNFTGCSTYTSPSGVNKEMRFALPIILISFFIGSFIFIINAFI